MSKLIPSFGVTTGQDVAVPIAEPQSNKITGGKFNVKIDDNTIEFWLVGEIYYDLSGYNDILSILLGAREDQIIHFNIHSPGGALPTCCQILSAMISCKAKIITHNIGCAASCGSLLWSFGNKMTVSQNAVTMFHNSRSGLYDSTHRVLSTAKHSLEYLRFLLSSMNNRGLLLEDEVENILKRDAEYYITSDIMHSRLLENNLLYTEGDNVW
jgi:ATP-dependent protease ClpP protease subunit